MRNIQNSRNTSDGAVRHCRRRQERGMLTYVATDPVIIFFRREEKRRRKSSVWHTANE